MSQFMSLRLSYCMVFHRKNILRCRRLVAVELLGRANCDGHDCIAVFSVTVNNELPANPTGLHVVYGQVSVTMREALL
jgi:hypothetical protein